MSHVEIWPDPDDQSPTKYVMVHVVKPDGSVIDSYRINEDDLDDAGRLGDHIVQALERDIQREVIE